MIIHNDNNELIPTRAVTGWRVGIDYRKLNAVTRKDHFHPQDQEKPAFTCPFGVYAYKKMSFKLCNALPTFQRCMLVIFADLVEKCIDVFMVDFSVFGDSFDICQMNLETVLERCVETNLEFNLEIRDKSGKDNLVVDHLSRLINEEVVKGEREITEAFPDEKLFLLQEIVDCSYIQLQGFMNYS
ncbi:PREDICTED: uncharacterized protein LOC109327109 [Lupinus angustifolius]|uniref:uncharacterized protein LOC109327109 n=1 Tax=Lupinus angustifolius TaxID=3871 RepID=UPI00092F19F8|nr:PREDICTED: uncharacterized protein LOC109327109 [Lupinus angustifolius]